MEEFSFRVWFFRRQVEQNWKKSFSWDLLVPVIWPSNSSACCFSNLSISLKVNVYRHPLAFLIFSFPVFPMWLLFKVLVLLQLHSLEFVVSFLDKICIKCALNLFPSSEDKTISDKMVKIGINGWVDAFYFALIFATFVILCCGGVLRNGFVFRTAQEESFH